MTFSRKFLNLKLKCVSIAGNRTRNWTRWSKTGSKYDKCWFKNEENPTFNSVSKVCWSDDGI